MGAIVGINQADERQILIELQSGDQHAFEKIYKSYSHRIYGNILKMVKSEDDAEELLQGNYVQRL